MDRSTRLAVLSIALLALACGGSSSGSGVGADAGQPPANPAGSWLSFSPSPVDLVVMPGQAKTFLLSARSSRTFTEPIQVAIIDRAGVTSGETTVTALSPTVYEARMSTRSTLASGTHTGTFEVRLCYDAPGACARPLPGSPWQIPYSIFVVDPSTYRLAGWEQVGGSVPFTNDYALSASGSALIAVAAGFYSDVMETWRSTDDGATWTKLTVSGPDLFTRNFALAPDGTNVYLSGGRIIEETTPPRFASHVWKFDGASWQARTAAAPFPAREDHAMVSANGALYVLGGRSQTDLLDVWKSSDEGATWTSVGQLPSGAGGYRPCAAAWNGGLVVARSGIWSSTDGAAWTAHAGYAHPYRLAASHCAVLDGRLFVQGDGGPYGVALVSSADLEAWQYEPGGFLGAAPGMPAVNGRLFLALGPGTTYRPLKRTLLPSANPSPSP